MTSKTPNQPSFTTSNGNGRVNAPTDKVGGPVNNRTTNGRQVNPIDPLDSGAMPPNGNGNGGPPEDSHVPMSFDQPVILRQSPSWAKAIAIAIMGVTTASVTWACIAEVEETVGCPRKARA